jgi:hypothetical protein
MVKMINELYMLILIGALSVIILALIVSLIVIKSKNKRLAMRVADLNEAANESYVKFISDSRDWAYEYIETVQEKLSTFATKVEPQLNYFNTYGTAVSGPHTILVKEITEAYEELKTIMPQDNKEK